MNQSARRLDESPEHVFPWKKSLVNGSYHCEVGGIEVTIKPNFEVGPKNAIRKIFEIHHHGTIVARRTQVSQAKYLAEGFMRVWIDQLVLGLSGLGAFL